MILLVGMHKLKRDSIHFDVRFMQEVEDSLQGGGREARVKCEV